MPDSQALQTDPWAVVSKAPIGEVGAQAAPTAATVPSPAAVVSTALPASTGQVDPWAVVSKAPISPIGAQAAPQQTIPYAGVLGKVAQFSQDIGEAANKTVNGIYGHLTEIPSELFHVANDAPKNTQENMVYNHARQISGAPGGQVALASYRAASGLVDAAKQLWESTPENYEIAKQKMNEALAYFHAGDYRNAAASVGTATGANISMIPGVGSMVGEPIKGISEGARPGADLSKPAAQAAVDAATLLIMGKAPEIMDSISIVPKVAGEVTGKVAGAVGEAAGKAKELVTGKPATAPELVGKVTQATGEDIATAANALKSVDTSKVQTFADLSKTLDAKVRENTAKVDAALSKSTEIFKPADLEKRVPVEGGTDIISSPVKEALSQLRDYYEKTNDTEGIAKIQGLQAKEENGLTVKEINDIARLHGRDLNAYNAAGELASGLGRRAAENTRMDVKDIVRKLTPDEETKALDKNTSDLITTRDMTDQMAEKVQKLQNKFEKAGLLQKIGAGVGKIVDVTTGGMVKGILRQITGVGETEGKTLTPIEIEKNLSKNLKLLDNLNAMDPAAALKEVQNLSPVVLGVPPTGIPRPTPATEVRVPGSIDLETRKAEPEKEIAPTKPAAELRSTGISVEYKLPTKSAMNIPAERRPEGTFSSDILEHEFGGHAANAAIEGYNVEHIKSHLHPEAGSQTSAAARIDFTNVGLDSDGLINVESGRNHIDKIMAVIMGGAAQDELNGIPFEMNKGISGDIRTVKGVLKGLGYAPEEVDAKIRAGLERAKNNLTQPGMQGIIKANAAVREEGLHEHYHASPERIAGFVKEVQRIRDENIQRVSKRDVGVAREVDKGVEPEREGVDQEGTRPEVALETSRGKETPVTDELRKNNELTTNPLNTAFIAPNGDRIGVADHDAAIDKTNMEKYYPAKGEFKRGDSKREVIKQERLVRIGTRVSRRGDETYVSVPESGVTPEQIEQIKQTVGKIGRLGNLVLERSDVSAANADKLVKVKEFARPSDVEPMLREIQAHPEQVARPVVNAAPPTPTPELKSEKIAGGNVSKPAVTYHEASAGEDNPWVRRSADPEKSAAPTNKGRQIMVQFSSDLINKDLPKDTGGEYYDKLYGGARPGYARLRDFWEIPQWMGFVSHVLPDADVYVVRDIEQAKRFLNTAGYDRALFSALDVNMPLIKELAKDYKGRMDVGGYVKPGTFLENPNITYHASIEDMIKDPYYKEQGIQYRNGTDYRHFEGSDVIPRLTMSDGCLHKCAFCVVEKKVTVTPEQVVDQQAESMGKLGAKLVYLNDKTFGQASNYQHLSDVYDKMKNQNPDFQGFIVQTTAAQMGKIPANWLKKSGIKYVELGIESYNDPILKEMHKPANQKLIDAATQKLRDNNIALIPNILVGLPGETAQTYANTLKFLKDNKDIISHANIYNLAVYENSELAKKLTTASPDDFNENVLEKSFHSNPEVHRQFAGDLYGVAQDLLDKKPGQALSPSQNLRTTINAPLHISEMTDDDLKFEYKPERTEFPGWARKASAEAKVQSGGFTINPKTGKMPDSGFLVEARPESRVVLDHPATAQDIQKFYQDNKAYLDKHPELYIGGWRHELNISAHAENQTVAENLAKKLDQISIYDVENGKEIPTGGEGKQTTFPDYPLEKRMADLRSSAKFELPTTKEISPRLELSVTQEAAGIRTPPERTTGDLEKDNLIKAAGATPAGIQKGDASLNLPDIAMFHDPKTNSTLAVPVDKLSRETIEKRLQDSRKDFKIDLQATREPEEKTATLPFEKPKPPKQLIGSAKGATTPLMKTPLVLKGPGEAGEATIVDLANALNDWSQAGLKPKKEIQTALNRARAEMQYQLANDNSGLNWYKKDTTDAIDHLKANGFPELEKPLQNKLFRTLWGITSYGVDPNINLTSAAEAWKQYKQTGKIPLQADSKTNWPGYSGIKGSITLLNKLIDEKGEQGTIDWLTSKHPVSEIREQKLKTHTVHGVAGKAGDEKYGAFIFGPKGGPYVLNLQGISDHTTVDVWGARMIRRWTGTLTPETMDQPVTAEEAEKFHNIVQNIGKEFNLDIQDAQAVLWGYEHDLYEAHGVGEAAKSYKGAADKYVQRQKEGSIQDYIREQSSLFGERYAKPVGEVKGGQKGAPTPGRTQGSPKSINALEFLKAVPKINVGEKVLASK